MREGKPKTETLTFMQIFYEYLNVYMSDLNNDETQLVARGDASKLSPAKKSQLDCTNHNNKLPS